MIFCNDNESSGYMSPEYAMEGLFSVKSDVFAFGVLLLEILSGKKNTGFRDSDCLSLLGYVGYFFFTIMSLTRRHTHAFAHN